MKRYRDIADPSLAKALAHPLRTRILGALENRTASPSELATELGAPLGVVSYHVRRLAALRFVKLVKRVPRRGAVEHYYTAIAGPTFSNEAWSSTPSIVKEATIGAALQEVGARASAAAANGGFEQPDSHLTRSPVTVDAEGWSELARELDGVFERVKQIESASRRRLERADHDGEQQATVVLMLFNEAAPVPSAAPADAASSPGRLTPRP